MSNISPLAFVHPDSKIGNNVEIGPFSYIDKNVEIGDNTIVMANATILYGARIGVNCKIFPNSVISAIPQDLKFKGEDSLAIIGDNTIVRECATINRGTASKKETFVGNDCLLMAYSHIAHDCIVKNNVIIGNATQIAGEVEIDEFAILSASVLVHQFSKIGCHCMIQGGSRIPKDIPPYIMVGRDPIVYAGINIVGLRRRGFTTDQINIIQEVYRYIYNSSNNITQALEKIVNDLVTTPEIETITNFIRSSERGILKDAM